MAMSDKDDEFDIEVFHLRATVCVITLATAFYLAFEVLPVYSLRLKLILVGFVWGCLYFWVLSVFLRVNLDKTRDAFSSILMDLDLTESQEQLVDLRLNRLDLSLRIPYHRNHSFYIDENGAVQRKKDVPEEDDE